MPCKALKGSVGVGFISVGLVPEANPLLWKPPFPHSARAVQYASVSRPHDDLRSWYRTICQPGAHDGSGRMRGLGRRGPTTAADSAAPGQSEAVTQAKLIRSA